MIGSIAKTTLRTILTALTLAALASTAVQAQGLVEFNLNGPASVPSGATFSVTVRVDTGGTQQVDLAEVHLDFDPSILNVVSLSNQPSQGLLPTILVAPSFDNSAGTVDFAAGTFSNFPSAPFDLLIIEFQAIADGTSDLTFADTFPRETIATFGGGNILNAANDSSVTAGGGPGSGTVLYRINVGGAQVAAADASSPDWAVDTSATPSVYRTAGGGNIFDDSNSSNSYQGPVNGAPNGSAPEAIYKVERWDPPSGSEMLWQFPISPNTDVQINLHFAELYNGVTAAGQRVFDVSVEGVVPTEFNDIDPFAEAFTLYGDGAKGAVTRSFTTTITDGTLDLEFLHDVIENPALKGIEIIDVTVPPPANDPPVVAITNPATGLTFNQNDPISFQGTSTDEDGDLSAGIVWSSSIDGAFGSGTPYVTSALELSPGTHTITASSTDSGSLTGSASIVVIIEPAPDNEKPVFDSYTPPDPQEGDTLGGKNFNYPLPTATDNIDPNPEVVCTPAPGSLFPVGTTPVSCTATDDASNESDPLNFDIVVTDTTPPVIDSVGDIVEEATGPAGADVAYTTPNATDIVDGTVAVSCLPASPVSVGVDGMQQVNCDAMDAQGNPAATESFTISVVDTTPPLITLNGDNPLELLQGDSYTDPGFTADDLVDGDVTGLVTVGGDTVDTATPGTYVVTYSVFDNAGNEGTAQRTVNVSPPPVAGDVLYRINNGGPALIVGADDTVDDSEPDWQADTSGNPSPYVTVPNLGNTFSVSNTIDLTDGSLAGSAAPEALYQTERYDNDQGGNAFANEMQWDFPLPPVASIDLKINIYLAEIFNGLGGTGTADKRGLRSFDIQVEGSPVPVLTAIDPFTIAGSIYKGFVLSTVVTVTDGNLDLDFIHGIENPAVKGIEIIVAGGPDAAPVIDPIAAQALEENQTITGLPVNASDDDPITLVVTSAPVDIFADFASFSATGGLGSFDFMPLVSDAGDYTITVRAYDGSSSIEQFNLTVYPEGAGPAPAARVSITPGGNFSSSTFNNGSMEIVNEGTVDIDSVTIDLSTSVLPDVVFDPNGTAGDSGFKCLTPNATTGTPGFITPTDLCVDPFSMPHNGIDGDDGYDAMTLNFSDFNAGEAFTYSVDIDPTSIKNDTTSGDSGIISGCETVGATVTVQFADSTTLTRSMWEDGSTCGGTVLVKQELVPEPMPLISIVGVPTPATVNDPNQTVQLTNGVPNGDFALLHLDGRLYIDAGGGGYDIDPYEANSAIAKAVYTGSFDGAGEALVPVTLLMTASPDAGPDGGLNHFIATVDVGGGVTSLTSNSLVIEYDPAFVPDTDGDGVNDDVDNCVDAPNADQTNSDGDSHGDACDNCTLADNEDQRDSNGDGYGNWCDADLDDSGTAVNFTDLQLFRNAFGTPDADADLNGDGNVNFTDLARFRQLFGQPPGPSGVAP